MDAKQPDFGFYDDDTLAVIQATEEWWIAEARRNPLAFMEYVWGYKPAPHHVRWMKQFFDADTLKTVVIAPRGSAKTTVMLIAMLWYISHHPHSSNMILSVTARQAQDRIQFMADAIQNNERYARVFPDIVPDTRRSWTKTQFTVKNKRYRYTKWRSLVAKHGDPKSPTVFAAGVGGSGVIGSRVSNGILALDDLFDSKNSRTAELRDGVWSWLTRVVIPILTGKSRIWHVTTRWAEDDVAGRQIALGQYSYSYTRALERGPTGELRSYWPSLFPLVKLLDILKEVGKTVFFLMYQNTITGLAGEIFSMDMLGQGLPSPLPLFEEIFVSCDLAVTVSDTSDESAIATIGVRWNNRGFPEMYVLDMLHGQWKPGTTARKIEKAYHKAQRRFGTNPICLIETIAAQKVFLTLLNQNQKIPMSMIREYHPTVDKAIRARPVAAMGEDGRLFFDIPEDRMGLDGTGHWYWPLISQMVEFTGERGNADDLVDAITQVGQFVAGDVRSRTVTRANTKVVEIPLT